MKTTIYLKSKIVNEKFWFDIQFIILPAFGFYYTTIKDSNLKVLDSKFTIGFFWLWFAPQIEFHW